MGVIIQGKTVIQGKTIFGTIATFPVIAASNNNISTAGATQLITTNTLTAPASTLLVLITDSFDYLGTLPVVTSSPSLTWTKQVTGGVNGTCDVIFTAPFVAGGSITTTTTWTTGGLQTGTELYAVTGYSAVGATSAQTAGGAAATYSITTTKTNSLVLFIISDINGIQLTPTLSSPCNLIASWTSDSKYWYWVNVATVGTFSTTITNPTSGANNGGAMIEIKS